MSTLSRAALGFGLVCAGLATVLVGPAAAHATPPSGVSAQLISKVTIGHTDYVLREVTIAPGGSTGWHYHDGTVLGGVTSGTLTHLDADCSVVTYGAGQAIVEPSGANHVHIGRNDGTAPVVLYALYVLPVGAPFSEDAADPGCARA